MTNQFSNGYALLVGVGRYRDSRWSVPVTAKDVDDIKSILIDPHYCAYPQSQVTVLSHEAATSQNTLQALGQLAEDINHKQAMVILFFSGHGLDEEGVYYFLAHEAEFFYDDQHKHRVNPQTVIANDDLVAHIRTISQRANKTLVMFNTCFSGGLGTPLGPEDHDLQKQFVPIPLSPFESKLDNLAQGKGTALFTSSQQHQLSWVFRPTVNSLFVDKVLSALKGTDIPDTGSTINLLPFIDTVKTSVRETALSRGKDQDPDYKIYGGMEGEFPIALRLGGQSLSADGDPQPPAPTIPREYNFSVIHELLAEAFDTTDLDQFLRNSSTPGFKKIRRKFSPNMGLDKMINVVIDYCTKFLLMETLLVEVKAYNPAQYELYSEKLYR